MGVARLDAWHDGSDTEEVVAITSLNDQSEPWPEEDLTFDELARRQGVEPVAALSDLAQPGLWESDEEYEEFLADLYASRRAGLA